MDLEILENVLEALLFVSGQELKISEICESLEVQKSEIDKAISNLKNKYNGKCGIHLITFSGKIQFGSNPNYTDLVSKVLNPIREKALSNAALETVAIIAYRQPITRLEIENIRGVNSDYAINMLLKNNLIEVVGRKDAIGKPLLFGTTDEFLKRFGIESLEDLPDYEKLLESIKIINSNENESISIFNEENSNEISSEERPEFLDGEDVSIIE